MKGEIFNMAAGQLPDTLFIGPMRTGTTWTYDYLRTREDVCLPKGVKETLFFDRHFTEVSWYQSHFQHYDPHRHGRVVEVAPSYFHCPEAPERIARLLGRPRLVVIVRDPVKRCISHYRHLRRRGLTKRPILEAVEVFPEIVEASRYAAMIKRWEIVFGEGAVKLLFQEDLKASPSEFAASLCKILELPYRDVPADLIKSRVNSASDPPNFLLARLGKKAADYLRSRRLYAPVHVAKAVGLKQVFFGSGQGGIKPTVTQEELHALTNMLADDMAEFEQRLVGFIKGVGFPLGKS